jgi:hypothetical protein
LQAIRISPIAYNRLRSLTAAERKPIIAEMRKATEMIIIAMTDKQLARAQEKS